MKSIETQTNASPATTGQNDREFVWDVYFALAAESAKLHHRALGRSGEAARLMRREYRRIKRRLVTLSALVVNDPAHIAAGTLGGK